MEKDNNPQKIEFLENEILKLKEQYNALLKQTGKFNELKNTKIKLRAYEVELGLLR